MFNFKYEIQGVNTYLVYKIGCDELIDSLSLGMLTNNNIPGVINTLFTQMDEEKFIKYNVSAKISLKQFFSGVVNRKRLLGAFEGIVDGLISAEDYMIDISSIILDPEYIFVDVSTCIATLICLPIRNIESEKPNLGVFFKNIMMNTQFDQTENSDHVAKIFNFLNGSPVFSLSDFKKLLDGLKNENIKISIQPQKIETQTPVQKVQNSSKSAVSASVQPKASEIQPPIQSKPQKKTQPVQPVVNNTAVKQDAQPQPDNAGEPDKKMSFFYLLQHYNKENKAIYDRQKAARKKGDVAPVKKSVTQHNKQSTVNPGFAVPGMNQASGAMNFTVPGQKSAQSVQQAIPTKQTQQVVKQPTSTVVEQSAQQVQNKPHNPPTDSQGQSINFGETTVLGGGAIGETTVLTAAQNPNKVVAPHLIRKKNNEKIPLNKPIFRIGKEKSYVDYFIGDNTAVSRSHANIITRENTFFIVDTNSTNHTFVNGKMIQSNTETKIHHGDKIRLGNEDFEFKIY